MDRIRQTLLKVLLGLVLVVPMVTTAAPPALPASFWGTVQVDGAPLAEGTRIQALIGDKVYADGAIRWIEDWVVYSLNVPADDSATPTVVEGGRPGDVVRFAISGRQLLPTALWQGGTSTRHDLADLRVGVTVTQLEVLEGQTAHIDVVLSASPNLTVTVVYTTEDGTALVGGDYVATTGTLVFAPGVTKLSVSVPTMDDALDEDAETFRLVLSGPSAATLWPDRMVATITIVDDDDSPVVAFERDTYMEREGAGAFRVNACLSVPSGRPVAVDYATADGSAHAHADYTPVSGTLTYPPGELCRSVAVPILVDAENEPPETLSLTLTNPRYATLGVRRQATLVIHDDSEVPIWHTIFAPIVHK
jgi:hypothetical protein